MSWLSDITLLRPWWLLALVPLAALVWVMSRRKGIAGDWEAVVDPQLMQALSAMGRVDAGHGGRIAKGAILGAVLLIVALAGPAVERRDAVAFRNLDGVVFVLDAPSVIKITSPARISASCCILRASAKPRSGRDPGSGMVVRSTTDSVCPNCRTSPVISVAT